MAAATVRDKGTLSSNATEDHRSMHDNLDLLWQRYLTHLDQYQKAQNELQKQLSSSFFSLAQANYKSPNRRRYGQDFYDERMKASRRCHIQETNGGSHIIALDSTRPAKNPETDEKQSPVATEGNAPEKAEPTQQPSPPATPSSQHSNPALPAETDVGKEHDEDVPPEDEDPPKPPRDPLHWFGILVPRELRSAQASFSTAIGDPACKAINAARGMREVEMEIRKLRKAIRKAEKASFE